LNLAFDYKQMLEEVKLTLLILFHNLIISRLILQNQKFFCEEIMPIIPSPETGKEPEIHNSAYIAPTAVIIGDVTIGEGSNVWFGAVLRGDWGTIKIGNNTSIQENVTIHIEAGSSVIIGNDCIIGHHAKA